MIDSADRHARPGDLVAVHDKHGALFGHGLYNPRSQIAVRMLRFGPQPIDDAFWRDRLAAAIHLRRQTLRLDDVTDGYRLVHAEGDGLSGLVVDRYADHLVLEVFSLGIWQRTQQLGAWLVEQLGPPPAPRRGAGRWRVVVRADERAADLEGFPPRTDPADAATDLLIREHGLRFRVDPRGGHKTGFFFDQRDNRRAFAALCRDADVLDLCCYSGGFGIHAAKAGARSVTGVDLDESAVALARENAGLNQLRVQAVHADVFGYLRQMVSNQRRFDAVVLDPPRLIASRDDAADGRQRYLDFNKLALAAVRPGGLLLTCSCSGLLSRDGLLDVVRHAARIAQRRVRLTGSTGAAGDHPVALDCPESEYLKALWLAVE